MERLIRIDYCASKGGCQEFLAPGPQTDFFDNGLGFHRCDQLVAYLAVHNPGIDTALIGTQCRMKKDSDKAFPVPDIITHDATRTEFYEIKPNSASGIRKGVNKILWFEPICDSELLPYTAGTKYRPDRRIILYNGPHLGNPATVSLHYKLERPGLLVYEFCVEVTQESVARALCLNLIALVLVALIVVSEGAALPAIPELLEGGALIPALASVGSPMRGSTGAGGANHANDVAYVQALLNDWRFRNGRDLIAVDGISGPRTVQAIADFQSVTTGIADARLDPGGPAIVALERDHLIASAANAAPAAQAYVDAGGTPAVWQPIFETPDDAEEPIEEITEIPRFETLVAAIQDYLNHLHDTAIEFSA